MSQFNPFAKAGGATDTYTKTETDTLLAGKADIVNGKVPAAQLPSYVDDVLEYDSTSAFPATGENGKIYVATDTNKTYRWGGSTYVEISESLALGETASTAYPGNKGKANADALAKKPGEITTGKQYVIDGRTVMAAAGAEAFNDLTKNKATGQYSHSEGTQTTSSGANSHAEGGGTKASGDQSHAEGGGTTASGANSHAEGTGTTAYSYNSHAEGQGTTAVGGSSHAEGQGTTASGAHSHAEGQGTTASSDNAHAEGFGSKAVATAAHAEGASTIADGQSSHTEGVSTIANGKGAHAEGQGTTAVSDYTHAEGLGTTAMGAAQHAQGKYNKQDSNHQYAFIIGNGTGTNNLSNAFAVAWDGSVIEGSNTTASIGTCSHVEGYGTVSSSSHQHVQGRYNVSDTIGKYAFIIGNGNADDARHNAFAIDWNGLIYVNGAATGVDVATLATDLASLTARVESLDEKIGSINTVIEEVL